MFFELIYVRTLDISCMGLNKKDCKQVIGAFKEVNEQHWGLNNNTRSIVWNEDLKCSPSTALDFCTYVIPNVYNLKLRRLCM